ncbi:MAG: hypothetical protein AAGJ52_13290 [Pseudomonadota bacterium]
MTDTATKLAELFESDRGAEDFQERFPSYGFVHADIGCKPWHEPAEAVWQAQGDTRGSADPKRWQEPWETLQSLHADFLAAQA